jgi:hypothetical protein
MVSHSVRAVGVLRIVPGEEPTGGEMMTSSDDIIPCVENVMGAKDIMFDDRVLGLDGCTNYSTSRCELGRVSRLLQSQS